MIFNFRKRLTTFAFEEIYLYSVRLIDINLLFISYWIHIVGNIEEDSIPISIWVEVEHQKVKSKKG